MARKNAQIDAAEKDLLLLSGAVLDAAQDLLARHFAQLVDRLSHQTYRRGFEERRVKIRKANQLNIPADLHTAFAKTVINIGAHQAIGGNDRSTPLLEQLPGKALTSPRCFFCSEVKCIDAMCSLAYLEYVKGNIDKVKAHLDEIFKLDISRTDAIGLAYKIGLFK